MSIDKGFLVNHKRVQRLMRQDNLLCLRKRPFAPVTADSQLVNQFMPTLNPLFDKVLAIPGVAELIKPIIDQLKTTLMALAA
jgi:transposase InsO family protein